MKYFLMVAVLYTSFNANAGVAYLKGQYVSGMNRICIYNSINGDYYRTIKSAELCPLSIVV